MQFLRDLWEHDRAAVIVLVIAIIAILYYVYSQNQGNGLGSAVAPSTTNTPNSETPTVVTDQLSTILGALGQLTPVTNTLQPINTVTNNTTTNNAAPLTATLTTPPVTITQTGTNIVAGIGNDTARDAAIKAAEKKYSGASNAAALQAAIAAILKQYPRTGATT